MKSRLRRILSGAAVVGSLLFSPLESMANEQPNTTTKKPIAALLYNSRYQEFLEEVNQYKTNYKDRFDFRVYSARGATELTDVVNELNQLVDEGNQIVRVHYFDHIGPGTMFGASLDEWKTIPGIKKQDIERETIMGTCFGGVQPYLKPLVVEMARVSGSDYITGTTTPFFGITRYPMQNDTLGLISCDVILRERHVLDSLGEVLPLVPPQVREPISNKLRNFNPKIGASYMIPHTDKRYYIKSTEEGFALEVVQYVVSKDKEKITKTSSDELISIPSENQTEK